MKASEPPPLCSDYDYSCAKDTKVGKVFLQSFKRGAIMVDYDEKPAWYARFAAFRCHTRRNEAKNGDSCGIKTNTSKNLEKPIDNTENEAILYLTKQHTPHSGRKDKTP